MPAAELPRAEYVVQATPRYNGAYIGVYKENWL